MVNTSQSIDEYIASAPAEVRQVLEDVRATIRKAAPKAEERISYRMPAFFQDGALVYFAAFKRHLGLYPPVGETSLASELQRYSGPKGNLQFPLTEPIPHALITKVVKARIKENQARKAMKAKPAG